MLIWTLSKALLLKENWREPSAPSYLWTCKIYNPGQNVLGHLRKLGTKMHFAKLTHILPLKKAWGCCYKGLFLLSHSLPSSVDCVELKLEYITSTLHWVERGEGRCLNLTSYCVSVPRVLTRVVGCPAYDLSEKKLRFSSYLRAKVRCQGPAGSARTQPCCWGGQRKCPY